MATFLFIYFIHLFILFYCIFFLGGGLSVHKHFNHADKNKSPTVWCFGENDHTHNVFPLAQFVMGHVIETVWCDIIIL